FLHSLMIPLSSHGTRPWVFRGLIFIKAGIFDATGSVNIDNNATVNGGVVGQQVDLENHAAVNYDESLKNVGGGSNGTWKIQAGSWARE
ncbi:hypothetical protein SDD30_15245, partial [Moorella naiadis]|uniref:DUF7305 domain-containing protein n=1 Tax=Moorella naiadis (nom. illeg.) TaxID=3093670 RepID=UPI003D9CB0C5